MRIALTREKETKNTVRYKELGDEQWIGMVYLPKQPTLEALGNPDRIELMIAAAAGELAEAA